MLVTLVQARDDRRHLRCIVNRAMTLRAKAGVENGGFINPTAEVLSLSGLRVVALNR